MIPQKIISSITILYNEYVCCLLAVPTIPANLISISMYDIIRAKKPFCPFQKIGRSWVLAEETRQLPPMTPPFWEAKLKRFYAIRACSRNLQGSSIKNKQSIGNHSKKIQTWIYRYIYIYKQIYIYMCMCMWSVKKYWLMIWWLKHVYIYMCVWLLLQTSQLVVKVHILPLIRTPIAPRMLSSAMLFVLSCNM